MLANTEIQAVFVDFGKQIQNDTFHLPPTPHAWWITLLTPPFPSSPPTPFPKSCIDLTVLSRFIQTSKLSNHTCYALSFRTWKCGFVGHFGALATSAEKTVVMGESFEKNMMCFVAECSFMKGLFKILVQACFAFRELKCSISKIIHLFFQS